MAALGSLTRGEVHAAGLHLWDAATGDYNAPFVQAAMGGRPVVLVSLGVWDEGLLVRAGNPLGLCRASDLASRGVRLANREVGAGSRLLLDTLLDAEGVPPTEIAGYGSALGSHQAVAAAVAADAADVGFSTAAVATVYGLGFVPLRQVRYDLAMLETTLEEPPVRQLLATLQHRWVRSQLEVLGGYDTDETGQVRRVAASGRDLGRD
jgi:molybdate-binding protein